jgi:hypothetical protein
MNGQIGQTLFFKRSAFQCSISINILLHLITIWITWDHDKLRSQIRNILVIYSGSDYESNLGNGDFSISGLEVAELAIHLSEGVDGEAEESNDC